jgi:hypothetical protein
MVFKGSQIIGRKRQKIVIITSVPGIDFTKLYFGPIFWDKFVSSDKKHPKTTDVNLHDLNAF